jgi:hypothetical protein
MFQRRILKLAVTIAAVIGMAGGLSALATGTGVAATQAKTHAVASSATASATRSVSAMKPDYEVTVRTISAGDWFFPSAGGGPVYMPANDTVDVTCYYVGSKDYSGDYELDHVTYTQFYGTFPGHIPDINVNFGGREASQAGVPHC